MIVLRPAGDRGSMLMAMLVVTVGLGLSAMLAPVVIRQFSATRSLVVRNTELNAAQAGMDLMMARVRAASDNQLNGLLEDLPPCTLDGTAGVGGAGDSLAYHVTIQYRDQDGAALTCPLTDVPTTAVVTSVGADDAGGARTLTATYVFTTSNTNIPGGAIRIDTSSAGQLCIDAGASIRPAAGTKATLQLCNGNSRQQFGYTYDLYLKLVNSESSTASFGMCLDAGATHASGNVLAFLACPSTRTPRYQWALNGSSQFISTSPSSGNTDNYCMTVQTVGSVGSNVVLSSSCGTNTTLNIWRSETGVGAGMAGDTTAQLVNYAQFSRCFDLTSADPNAKYLIAWFCKQSPKGAVDWNQQWVHPAPSPPAISATGNIVVTKSGVTYCLTTPATTSGTTKTIGTAYPTVVACTPGNAIIAQQWTVYHDTGDYGTSYRIMDSSGFCLAPTDQNAVPRDATLFHGDGTSKIRIAVCSSSDLQKWNAPPNINKPTPLTDLIEK